MPFTIRISRALAWAAAVVLSCATARTLAQQPLPPVDLPADAAAAQFGPPGVMPAVYDCEPQPWLATSADLLWLDRSTADDPDFLFADVQGERFALVNPGELVFSVAGGVRAQAVYGDPCGDRLQLAYAGVYDQTASISTTFDPADVDQLGYVFLGTTQAGALSYTSEYQSALHSVEANWGVCPWGPVRPLVGMRWIQQREAFEIYETPAPDRGAVIDVNNDLVGTQMGFELVLWDRGHWLRTEAGFKGGFYQNFVRLDGDLHDSAGPQQELRRDFDAGALAGEITVTAVWQLTSCIAWRFGYTGLWLAEVGLAPQQLNNFDLATGDGELELDGVSYQGGHIGLEVVW